MILILNWHDLTLGLSYSINEISTSQIIASFKKYVQMNKINLVEII